MTKRQWNIVGWGLTSLLLVGLTGGCADNSAATNAIEAAFPGATIVEMELEDEGGLKIYEAELTQGGKEIEVEVLPDGTIIEVETEVSMEDLPGPVAAAITKAAKGGEIKEIEKEETRATVKDGKLVKLDPPKVTYEAEILIKGKEKEIEVAPDGTILDDDDDDDD